LEDENTNLRQTLEQRERSLSDSNLVHLQELAGRLQDLAEIKRLNRALWRAKLGLLARDILTKQELHTVLPNPFLE
jgi:hypothetical protein